MAEQNQNQDNSATGGMLVILGIVVALGLVYFAYTQGMFGGKTDINVNMPNVEAPKVSAPDVAPDAAK
ncbi:MAG: hypothetical protein JWM96_601 [Alphaproteobacteria bacterium]|nr:hypothetical protein [Alphaproteobacteria bacterium]